MLHRRSEKGMTANVNNSPAARQNKNGIITHLLTADSRSYLVSPLTIRKNNIPANRNRATRTAERLIASLMAHHIVASAA